LLIVSGKVGLKKR